MYRRASEADAPALLQLWQQVFGDEEGFVSGCLRRFAGLHNVVVAQNQSDALQAMLLAVPCMAGQAEGVYLYALATAQAARGKGVMSGLMAYAEKAAADSGKQFAALVPANAGLFSFYQKRGYTVALSLRYLELNVPPPVDETGFAARAPVPGGLDAQNRLRAAHMPLTPIVFSENQNGFMDEDLAESGALFVKAQKAAQGFCLCMRQGERLLVPELFAAGDGEALRMLSFACKAAGGASKIWLSLPEQSPLFEDKGEVYPFALVKVLGVRRTFCDMPKKLYLRLALEDIPAGFAEYPPG